MSPRSLIDPSLIVIVSPMGPIRHRTLVRRVLTCRGTNGVVMRSDLTTLSDVEVVIYILGLSKESFVLVAHLLVGWHIFERIYELIATKQLLLYFVSLVIDLLSFLLLLLGGQLVSAFASTSPLLKVLPLRLNVLALSFVAEIQQT